MLDMLDYTIRIGSTPTFLYFDLYLYSAYAAHYVQYISHYAHFTTKQHAPCATQISTFNPSIIQS